MSPIAVNGVEIPDRAIDAEVQYHPAPTLDAARAEAAHALVVRELLRQECRRLGHDLDDEEAAFSGLLESALQVPRADAATCRRYYENNRSRFRSPDLFEARHILFPADPADDAARATAKAGAEQAIAALSRDPERFADLARSLSACPSAAQGGSLGQITRGQTVPEFETFLVALEPGQLCPVPVATPFGFHVLRLDRRIDGRERPFESVHAAIAAWLHDAAWTRAVHQYIGILAGNARINGIALGAAASLLVQ
jgi:peptidyl-prolyl cis-trans isomerase C